MIFRTHIAAHGVLSAVLIVGACNPPEPPPSRYVDLGTPEAPLPPPPQAWHDPELAKGNADFKPFRKPAAADEKMAEAKPVKSGGDAEAAGDGAEGGPGAEKEIRELAADFNSALAANDLEKATEFLNDQQAEVSKDVFAAVNKLVEQLRALKEAAPSLAEKMDQLAPSLSVQEALKVEVQTVRVVDEKNATAQLVGGREIKIVVGEEDFWYLESPGLTLMEKERSKIEKLAADIEAALAKGAPDEATVTALGTAIDELKSALTAPAAAKPEGESG